MNIEEVLYLPVKKEGFTLSADNGDCISRYRTLDGEEVSSSFKAKSKEELLDLQKPEVEQFVADWYEENKEGLWETVIDLIRVDERLMYKHANPPEEPSKEDKRFLEWLFREDDAFEILSDMHKFGYTVQKEKLYTVEIPNPNAPIEYHSKLAKNHKGEIVIEVQDWMNRTEYYQLTEKEIRKDFGWAWQFAEEVTK
ncbi:MAG: hypothetical protein DI617_03420 [Streptococcus pyogenes]|nr:MAG: hypothetical protein DI617_03420 [Streptococcus pyogenes]